MGELHELGSAPRRRARSELVDERIALRAGRESARVARRWVMDTLARAGLVGPANQVVELLTAELVGAALLRSPAVVWVRARFDGLRARVEVVDDADQDADPPARVLAVVDALAGSWGVLPGQDGTGRLLWFEVLDEPD